MMMHLRRRMYRFRPKSIHLGTALTFVAIIGSIAVPWPGNSPQFVARANDGLQPTPAAPHSPIATPTPPPQTIQTTQTPSPEFQAPQRRFDGLVLTGSVGYARSSGNCVNEPGVKRGQGGNPSTWYARTQTPYIGATFLMYSGRTGHTGIVTGIWSNGDVEVRHQNWWGGQHRFPRSAFRGFI